MKVSDVVLDILTECRPKGNIIYLPERQLDRQTYLSVNKVLECMGGKWNRKVKGHVFSHGDPAELLESLVLTGDVVDMKKEFQFFPTPRPVAEQMCQLAALDENSVVLEPSCGRGDLADVIYETGVKELTGIELNRNMETYLANKPYAVQMGVNFLDYAQEHLTDEYWDRIVMNPPFSKQQDISHILTAYCILKSGGILVSVVSESAFFRSNKKAERFRDFLEATNALSVCLGDDAFKESGTAVRTRLIRIEKPSSDAVQLSEEWHDGD